MEKVAIKSLVWHIKFKNNVKGLSKKYSFNVGEVQSKNKMQKIYQ